MDPAIRKLIDERAYPPHCGQSKLPAEFRAADEARARGEYNEALELLSRCIGWQTHQRGQRLYGHLRRSMGDWDGALAAFVAARKLAGDDPFLAAEEELNLSAVYAGMLDHESADAALRRASDLNPESFVIVLARIASAHRQGQVSLVDELLHEAVLKGRRDGSGETMMSLQRHIEADADFTGLAPRLAAIIMRLDTECGGNQ
ncbi:tetratricopeptide repeat protein [Donghicola eburneus]|uniref:tetratricopeptide repeat protein n=1 Tax=Donghicola eburneus TaxID=393278 RepID=UPI0008E9A471|nr:tetratricopeptide repeat protein [Donghicola eburneus]SFQ77739.1 hypothetical protein SAMN05421764_12012 [Donghicola eburneus]